MKRLAYQYSWYREIKAALRKAGKAGCFDSLMQDLDMADTRYTFVAEKNDKGDLYMTCLGGEGSPISSDLIPYPAKDFYHKIVNKLLALPEPNRQKGGAPCSRNSSTPRRTLIPSN